MCLLKVEITQHWEKANETGRGRRYIGISRGSDISTFVLFSITLHHFVAILQFIKQLLCEYLTGSIHTSFTLQIGNLCSDYLIIAYYPIFHGLFEIIDVFLRPAWCIKMFLPGKPGSVI